MDRIAFNLSEETAGMLKAVRAQFAIRSKMFVHQEGGSPPYGLVELPVLRYDGKKMRCFVSEGKGNLLLHDGGEIASYLFDYGIVESEIGEKAGPWRNFFRRVADRFEIRFDRQHLRFETVTLPSDGKKMLEFALGLAMISNLVMLKGAGIHPIGAAG